MSFTLPTTRVPWEVNAENRQRVLAVMPKTGTMARLAIRKAARMQTSALLTALEALCASGDLELVKVPGPRGKGIAHLYRRLK